ncbi:MAG: gliding motility-associated ABC transporter substrate-binding protein GldG, partial [Cytophagales bacterium]|nr:gliding motility-associated ABC transporter substrate-binding protein GldG [Cytophagales bacterium]
NAVLAGGWIIFIFSLLSLKWDITPEKRHSLSDLSREQLGKLRRELYVEVYLSGEDMPPAFRRLQEHLKDLLNAFMRMAPEEMFSYRFLSPMKEEFSVRDQKKYLRHLAEQGIMPTRLHYKEGGKEIETWVFPSVKVRYGNREKVFSLIQGKRQASAEEILNQSLENLEYLFLSQIQSWIAGHKYRVAMLTEHASLDTLYWEGVKELLGENYKVENVSLAEPLNPKIYAALCLLKPTKPFTEKEKYHLDQYLLNGGNILLFAEGISLGMEDLAGGKEHLLLSQVLGIEDWLFNCGIKILPQLLHDTQCAKYPVVMGDLGDRPQIQYPFMPIYPVVNHVAEHPILRNMEALVFRIASPLDTVSVSGVRKTPFLFSSSQTRISPVSSIISLSSLHREMLDRKRFVSQKHVLAYMLEGSFSSLYQHRLLPKGVDSHSFQKRGEGKLMVVGDGDFLISEKHLGSNKTFPVGFYPFEQRQYGNSRFLEHSLDYMLNEKGAVWLRNKHVQIRPLDQQRIREERRMWQILNLGIPFMFLFLMGGINFYLRRVRLRNWTSLREKT